MSKGLNTDNEGKRRIKNNLIFYLSHLGERHIMGFTEMRKMSEEQIWGNRKVEIRD